MIFSDLSTVLRRRWYLVSLGVLLTVALCVLASVAVPVRYIARAEVLLLPAATAVGAGGNPYVGLGGLSPAGDVLAKAMMNDSTKDELLRAGFVGEFSIGPDRASAAPLVLVEVQADSPRQALVSLNTLLGVAPGKLRSLQADLGIEEKSMITSTVVTRSLSASALRTPQLRAVIVAAAFGLAGTLVGVALLHNLLLRRPRRPDRGEARQSHAAPARKAAPRRRGRAGAPAEPNANFEASIPAVAGKSTD